MQKRNAKKKNNNTGKRQPRIVGRGDYNIKDAEMSNIQSRLDRIDSKLPDVKSGLAGLGAKLGGLMGSSDLGRSAGKGVAKILGFGDYHIVSNLLVKLTGDGNLIPKFSKVGNNGTRIVEREFLGDIVSSATPGTFFNRDYPLQPTNNRTFPWLSRLAALYDQWEPNGIMFEFVSTSSDFNGSAQGLGSIIMATDYDPTDPLFPDKRTMDNSDYASSSKPSNSQLHGIECDPAQRPTKLLFTQSIDDATPGPLNCLGNFQVASSGVSAASVTLGELWISYDITFYKKQLTTVIDPWIGLTGSYTTGGSFAASATINANTRGLWKITPHPIYNATMIVEPPPNLIGTYLVNVYYSTPMPAASWYTYPDSRNGTTNLLRAPYTSGQIGVYRFNAIGLSSQFLLQGPSANTDYSISIALVNNLYFL